MGDICKACGFDLSSRGNVYGTFCPKCHEFVAPFGKSPLRKMLEERKRRTQDIIRDHLRSKIRSMRNADRN